MSRTEGVTVGPPRVATDEAYVLAEGPFWDAPRQRLLWVDIAMGRVLEGSLHADGTITVTASLQLPSTVGAVATSEAGDWLIAGGDRLHVRSADGYLSDGPVLVDDAGSRRLNDGKPDPFGRYLVGTLHLDGPSATEQLFMVDGGTVTELDADLTMSNGLAWTADGSRFYSVDTMRGTIFVRPWGPDGPAGPRATFIELDSGHPDGMTIDAEGCLWVAVWGAGQVRRYDPDGRHIATIDIPAPQVSSVAFAGRDLRTLVITTSVQDLSPAELARHPDSGRLFTVELDIAGQPQPLWSGSR